VAGKEVKEMTMHVRDVMSTRLLCARRDTPLKELVTRIVRNRIGGLPIVDDEGHVLGIVSESDLQPTRQGAPGRPLRTASDVMTQPVIALTEDDSVTQAARVLVRHGIKRAPVLREGRIVGIVTRSDLLRPYLRTDHEIRADVEEAFQGEDLASAKVGVSVHIGIVTLEGKAETPRQAAVLARTARSVDGVVDVVSQIETGSNGHGNGHAPRQRERVWTTASN
jgi:CBS domain-containing protein